MSDGLIHEIERTAIWRSKKAEKHPYDWRNASAVKLLNDLAETTASETLSARYAAHEESEISPERWSEIHSDVLGEIGFHTMPKHIDEVMERIVGRCDRGLPGMHELVELMKARHEPQPGAGEGAGR